MRIMVLRWGHRAWEAAICLAAALWLPMPAPAYAGPWDRSNFLGDPGGLGAMLADSGVTFGLMETSEVLGNTTGGSAQGAAYEGLTQINLGVDLAKTIGPAGGVLNASAFQIHGRGLTANNLGSLSVASGIEANRATRLFELWYQQSLAGGKADIKIGQQSADLEFLLTQYGGLFINSSFGFPTLPSVDLPSGGPAYPLATLGTRLRVQATPAITTLLAVFDGSAGGLGAGDPQRSDASGTRFDLSSGAFVIGEVQYAINQAADARGLPGTYKLGGWYNSNAFIAPSVGVAGVGRRAYRGDWSVYASLDQALFRPSGKDEGAGVFLRVMGAPGDRNLVDVFVDGGVTYKGVTGRNDDTVGLAFGWTGISRSARAGAAAPFASGAARPPGSSETLVELTYQTQIVPWWTVQPDLQYLFSPAGGILGDGRVIKDEAVFGLRTAITF